MIGISTTLYLKTERNLYQCICLPLYTGNKTLFCFRFCLLRLLVSLLSFYRCIKGLGRLMVGQCRPFVIFLLGSPIQSQVGYCLCLLQDHLAQHSISTETLGCLTIHSFMAREGSVAAAGEVLKEGTILPLIYQAL